MALRVLLIDEPERAAVLADLLTRGGARVDRAATEAEAESGASSVAYDVAMVGARAAHPRLAARLRLGAGRPAVVALDAEAALGDTLAIDRMPRERWPQLISQTLAQHAARQRMRKHGAALATHLATLRAVNVELQNANRRLALVGELTRRLVGCETEAQLTNELLQAVARFTGSERIAMYVARKGGLAPRMALGIEADGLNDFLPCEPKSWRRLEPFQTSTPDLGIETDVTRLLGAEYYYLPLGEVGRAYGLLAVAGTPELADRAAIHGYLPTASKLLRQVRLLRNFRVLAESDSLTGLRNHASLQRSLRLELKRHQRAGRPLSLVLFDIDHFKAVNDNHGHPTGDKVLKLVAGLLAKSSRETDVAARYGGEEFALVLPDTDREGAEHKVAEFLAAVRALDLGPVGPLTVSAGIATFPTDGHGVTGLVAASDHALYAAKHGGRDRAMTYAEWLASTLNESDGEK